MSTIVVGLGAGDEGKGALVDTIVRERASSLVVRYSGGPQASHRVVSQGRSHLFSQFGSGTFAGAATLLSKFMMVDPLSVMVEAEVLQGALGANPLPTLHIDGEAPVITPYHVLLTRTAKPGTTCGKGIGALGADLAAGRPVLRMKDLAHPRHAAAVLTVIKSALDEGPAPPGPDVVSPSQLASLYADISPRLTVISHDAALGLIADSSNPVYEGAQGVLLDEWFGFHPFTTWATVTPSQAHQLHHDSGRPDSPETVGVIRCYSTRHGAGPLVTEQLGLNPGPDEHNGTNPWQGKFRIGEFDAVMLRYAVAAAQPDTIALTHLDTLPPRLGRSWWQRHIRVCTAYTVDGMCVTRLFPSQIGGSPSVGTAAQATAAGDLGRATPRYTRRWTRAVDAVRDVERHARVPVRWIGLGPDRYTQRHLSSRHPSARRRSV